MSALTVRFVGPVRRPGPERSRIVDTSSLVTVADVLRQMGYSDADMASLTVLLDGVHSEADALIAQTAVMDILLLVGGG